MCKKKSTEVFVNELRSIFGDKYDYSKVYYDGAHKKVCIVCPKHGEFLITPHSLLKGCGCVKCGYKKDKEYGMNDLFGNAKENGMNTPLYNHWNAMLHRCYDSKNHKINPTYIVCFVCEEWLYLSNFKKWFDENYIERWCLDKDILVKSNKEYSPDKCCFVPTSINSLVTHRVRFRGEYPIGVSKDKRSGRFYAYVNRGSGQDYIGCYSTPEEAFQAYKKAKEDWIKEVANKWKDKLKPNVYEALMNYQVEITD